MPIIHAHHQQNKLIEFVLLVVRLDEKLLAWGNQRLQRQFDGLLMMGIVMSETC
jgi:hypothetical protein